MKNNKIYSSNFSSQLLGDYGLEITVNGFELDQSEISRLSSKIQEVFDTEIVNKRYKEHPFSIEERINEKKEILNLFKGHSIYVEEVDNKYDRLGNPWYRITTSKGHFVVGWRKRVINIDWTDTKITLHGNDITNDDVTKSDRSCETKFIHAWGYEKAKEYLQILLN